MRKNQEKKSGGRYVQAIEVIKRLSAVTLLIITTWLRVSPSGKRCSEEHFVYIDNLFLIVMALGWIVYPVAQVAAICHAVNKGD